MACPRVVPDIRVTTFLMNSLCMSLYSGFLWCTVRGGYDLHKNRDFSRDQCSTARIMKNIEKGFIFEALKNR